jgi:hypothetical protein
MNTSDTQNTDSTSRPFGFWIKAVDRLMAAEFASAFDGEHASRRDWRILNVIDGSAPARRPLNTHKLHGPVERGWVVVDGDGWALTDEGRAAKDRLGGIVDGIRAKVTDAVSPEDLETTLRSLEQIARAFGWDEETPLPRGRGRRHGFGRHGFGRPGLDAGRHHGHRFGRGRDFAPGFGSERMSGADAEFGDHADHGHHEHGNHGCRHEHRGPRHAEHRTARAAQHAYERGFDAGFSRGRDA